MSNTAALRNTFPNDCINCATTAKFLGSCYNNQRPIGSTPHITTSESPWLACQPSHSVQTLMLLPCSDRQSPHIKTKRHKNKPDWLHSAHRRQYRWYPYSSVTSQYKSRRLRIWSKSTITTQQLRTMGKVKLWHNPTAQNFSM